MHSVFFFFFFLLPRLEAGQLKYAGVPSYRYCGSLQSSGFQGLGCHSRGQVETGHGDGLHAPDWMRMRRIPVET